ncbi:MAG TPA: FMN-binding protein [Anaerolineales bacterium]|nr:FMN-binding protein [Anaerolineales bacterium]
MSRNKSNAPSSFSRGIRKFFLSAFVVFSFVAYTVHERLTSTNPGLSPAPITPDTTTGQDALGSAPNSQAQASVSNDPATTPATDAPSAPATNAPAPTDTPVIAPPIQFSTPTAPSLSQGTYKDGTYTGPEVNVFYGLVQVQATVQNGKITDVQFLDYPHDRRTSQQINNFAMPYLQQEALQVQSANVQIISGATLTSEGFSMSLQNALATAH